MGAHARSVPPCALNCYWSVCTLLLSRWKLLLMSRYGTWLQIKYLIIAFWPKPVTCVCSAVPLSLLNPSSINTGQSRGRLCAWAFFCHSCLKAVVCLKSVFLFRSDLILMFSHPAVTLTITLKLYELKSSNNFKMLVLFTWSFWGLIGFWSVLLSKLTLVDFTASNDRLAHCYASCTQLCLKKDCFSKSFLNQSYLKSVLVHLKGLES